MANHLRAIACMLERTGRYERFPSVLRQAAKELFDLRAALSTAKGELTRARRCPDKAHMGRFACANRQQCWEPCGDLGKSAKHAKTYNAN
jgi:hypothetical protein